MPRTMRYTLATAAILVAIVCMIGWVMQAQAGAGLAGQLFYAAGAGGMVGLAIWALKHSDQRR